MEEIVCPKCHSPQLSANKKGFNTTNAGLGMLTGNALTGVAYGMIGSDKIVITCLKCGNQFTAGDGSIKTTDEKGSESYEKQIYVDRSKNAGRRIALILLIILIIIIVSIVAFFNSLDPNRNAYTPTSDDTIKRASLPNTAKKNTRSSKAKNNEPKTQGTYFVGAKSFCSNEYEDDCIKITITENGDVSYSDLTDTEAILKTGHIEGSTIVDADGKNLYIKYKQYHLYIKRGEKWIDFNELK